MEQEFLINFLQLLDKYGYDFYSCECCRALSFEDNDGIYFIEHLTNKEDLRKELNKNANMEISSN